MNDAAVPVLPEVNDQQASAAHAGIVQMAFGALIARTIYVVAELGIPDHVDRPRTAEEMAHATGTHAPTVYRLLRTSAGLGLFVEDSERRFALTPLRAALRSFRRRRR